MSRYLLPSFKFLVTHAVILCQVHVVYSSLSCSTYAVTQNVTEVGYESRFSDA